MNKMKRETKQPIKDSETIRCPNCGWTPSVLKESPLNEEGTINEEGTTDQEQRNNLTHCPNCLYSIHLDNEPGDRDSDCHGRMEPIGVWMRKNGEWAVIHRCTRCGKVSSNRTAADDNPMKLMALAMRPFGSRMIAPSAIRRMTVSMEGEYGGFS